MPGVKQDTIRNYWENSPLDLPFHLPGYRKVLCDLIQPEIHSGSFQLFPHAVEIGARFDPLCLYLTKACGYNLEEAILSDVIYKRQKLPLETLLTQTKLRFLSQGVPEDNKRIIPFMEKFPTVLFLESIVNYIGRRTLVRLLDNAQQVVVINNYLAGAFTPYNAHARKSPEEIEENLKILGYQPIVNKHLGLGLGIVGVFQK